MSVPKNQRANYERTDDLIARLEGLVCALEHLSFDVVKVTAGEHDKADAMLALIATIQEKVAEVRKTRAMEWVGLGGMSSTLTDDEMCVAMGEDQS
ncbi:hypothetical protein AB9K41_24575 [Cribrihabitans sp. XS_ASV171]